MPINAEYRGPGELPKIIPVFPLPGALLLPRGQMPLNIFEPRYLAMIDDAFRDGHRLVGMIQHVSDDERYRWLNDRVCAVEGEVRPRSDGSGFDVVLEVSEMVWEPVSG